MKLGSKIIAALTFASLVVACGVTLVGTGRETALGAGGQVSPFVPTVSAGANVSTTTSSVILATSTSRTYAVIVNDGTLPVYLALRNGAPATHQSGIRLSAGEAYEIRDVNLYAGAVSAIASTTGVTATNTQVTVTGN
jgi:hypothetical protein